jgi:hypothetical protein
VWTQGGYQVGRNPGDYPLFLAVHERNVDAWEAFFESFDLPTTVSDSPERSWTDHCRSFSSHAPHSTLNISRGTR